MCIRDRSICTVYPLVIAPSSWAFATAPMSSLSISYLILRAPYRTLYPRTARSTAPSPQESSTPFFAFARLAHFRSSMVASCLRSSSEKGRKYTISLIRPISSSRPKCDRNIPCTTVLVKLSLRGVLKDRDEDDESRVVVVLDTGVVYWIREVVAFLLR
eukprot:TRINITY_DN36638_c0_g1_i1.p1 TRINITY_DN36638_c0_g1~~TRINITY_DN36638_c0_g1_i1.p1  ORF type:complete len:159 (-),score=9.10 TRINITY_DN36638_c0_g1_i1:237-713(-)